MSQSHTRWSTPKGPTQDSLANQERLATSEKSWWNLAPICRLLGLEKVCLAKIGDCAEAIASISRAKANMAPKHKVSSRSRHTHSFQREELDPKQSLSHRGLYAGPF